MRPGWAARQRTSAALPASAITVMEYRRQHGLPADRVQLAILVQQLVASDVSAMVFSANPVTGSRAEVVINSGLSWAAA